MPKTVLQLTDIHLCGNAAETLRGHDTDDTLVQVLDHAQKDRRYRHLDAVILTGDLAQDGHSHAYHRLTKHLKHFSCPILWTPGNHDDLLAMRLAFKGHFQEHHHLILGHWQIILLNSLWPEHIGGQLSDAELQRLTTLLKAHAHLHTLIALHHPLSEQSADREMMLNNTESLLSHLKNHGNIQAFICGHIHRDTDSQIQEYRMLTTPSTCFQFIEQEGKIMVDEKTPPGYRWLELEDNGSLKTEVGYVNSR